MLARAEASVRKMKKGARVPVRSNPNVITDQPLKIQCCRFQACMGLTPSPWTHEWGDLCMNAQTFAAMCETLNPVRHPTDKTRICRLFMGGSEKGR